MQRNKEYTMIELNYEGKKPVKDILAIPPAINPKKLYTDVLGIKSYLYQGDNRNVLRHLADTETRLDFTYIDPPFATGGNFLIGNNRTSTISSSRKDRLAYSDVLTGNNYLETMRETFILLREVMSDESSLYVHIDTKQGHYFKVLLDEIFGSSNFRSDITRIKCNPKNFSRKNYGNIKDVILFYTKTKNYIWNDITQPILSDEIKKRFTKIDENGERYTTIPLHAPGETDDGESGRKWCVNGMELEPPPGRHWRAKLSELNEWEKQGLIVWSKNNNPRKKRYASEAETKGKKWQDVFEFKDPMNPIYPTQKNYDMLKLLIANSSLSSSVIMDCFCGSGTTLEAASSLGRKWIGIDRSDEAIKVCLNRLANTGFECYSFEEHSEELAS